MPVELYSKPRERKVRVPVSSAGDDVIQWLFATVKELPERVPTKYAVAFAVPVHAASPVIVRTDSDG